MIAGKHHKCPLEASAFGAHLEALRLRPETVQPSSSSLVQKPIPRCCFSLCFSYKVSHEHLDNRQVDRKDLPKDQHYP